MQQLGRGLRKYKDKQFLNVLDFIGNYEKAGQARWFLAGEISRTRGTGFGGRTEYPDDCIVDFDMKLVDFFEEMDRRTLAVADRIDNEFYRIVEQLERVPSRMELFELMDDEVYEEL